MKFLISMSDVEDEWDSLPAEEQERIWACHAEFERALGARHVVCYGLPPSGEARSVRLHADGRTSVTQGLMTQTKEPLGGFYIIEAESIEGDLEWAKRGPFRPGANEVGEIREE